MIVYHGTTLENYKMILEHGFDPSLGAPAWVCSNRDMVYVWNTEKILKSEYDGDDDLQEDAKYMAITNAIGNAQIQASLHSKADRVIVLGIDVPGHLLQDDDSCNNMDLASCVHIGDLSLDMIVEAYTSPFSQRLSLFYLASVFDSDYLVDPGLTPFELSLCEAIRKVEIPDEIYSPEYEEFSLES